jgi:hypothetical protein
MPPLQKTRRSGTRGHSMKVSQPRSYEPTNLTMNATASSFPVPSTVSPAGPVPVPEPISSPEFELLIACCSEISNRERAQRVQSIVSSGFDWDKMLRLVDHHRLVPQVYQQLFEHDRVPPEFIESLRKRYHTNARQALWFTSELIRIVREFESRGIAILPYKGPTLAETLYAGVTMRQFGDLDLLVHAADVPKAKAALEDLGYKSNLHFTDREELAYRASGYEYTFNSTHGRNLVEVKWQILPRFYSINFDVDAMFRRPANLVVGSHSLRTLCAEDLLLVLCVHAAKHAWVQLSWLYEITQLVKHSLNWVAIEEQSEKLGIERIVAVNFLLAHRLLGAPLPEMVEKSVRSDRAIGNLTAEILPIILDGTEFHPESIRYFRLMIKIRERWQDGVRLLWRLAFTSTAGEWSAIQLPAQLFPFYRLARMWRLAGKVFSSRS